MKGLETKGARRILTRETQGGAGKSTVPVLEVQSVAVVRSEHPLSPWPQITFSACSSQALRRVILLFWLYLVMV